MAGYRTNADMQDLAHATAHLIHGSSRRSLHDHLRPRPSDGRGNRGRELPLRRPGDDARPLPARASCKQGWNTTADGERFFFIPTPSAGLWATREKLLRKTQRFRPRLARVAVDRGRSRGGCRSGVAASRVNMAIACRTRQAQAYWAWERDWEVVGWRRPATAGAAAGYQAAVHNRDDPIADDLAAQLLGIEVR